MLPLTLQKNSTPKEEEEENKKRKRDGENSMEEETQPKKKKVSSATTTKNKNASIINSVLASIKKKEGIPVDANKNIIYTLSKQSVPCLDKEQWKALTSPKPEERKEPTTEVSNKDNENKEENKENKKKDNKHYFTLCPPDTIEFIPPLHITNCYPVKFLNNGSFTTSKELILKFQSNTTLPLFGCKTSMLKNMKPMPNTWASELQNQGKETEKSETFEKPKNKSMALEYIYEVTDSKGSKCALTMAQFSEYMQNGIIGPILINDKMVITSEDEKCFLIPANTFDIQNREKENDAKLEELKNATRTPSMS